MHLNTLSSFRGFMIAALAYAVYLLFYGIINFLNTALTIIQYKRTNSSKRCGKCGCILWKKKLSEFHMASKKDFICLYVSNVNLEYVLKPNVSLYCVTKHDAIFVETEENVNIYASEEHPFFFLAQFKRTNVVKIPIASFHALAEEVGDLKLPVMWLSSTGRCGSTLICQVLESVPNTLVMSEPDSPWNLCYLKQLQNVGEEEYLNILRSTIRLLCKPLPSVKRMLIKTRSPCSALMTDISEVFPGIKQMFLYRNCQETVSSWLAAMTSLPYLVVLRACADNEVVSFCFPIARTMIAHHFVCRLKPFREVSLNINTVGLFVHMWANQMLVARDAMARDQNIQPLKYEEVLAHPKDMCKTIFETMAIDFQHLDLAVAAFKKDSQRGSALSRSKIGNDPHRKISGADRLMADVILSSYKFPGLGESFSL